VIAGPAKETLDEALMSRIEAANGGRETIKIPRLAIPKTFFVCLRATATLGMLGVEQQSYARPKTLRPGFQRADRRRLPIMSAHERAHFAPAREESQPLATLPRPW
jgi:hypothetical protein